MLVMCDNITLHGTTSGDIRALYYVKIQIGQFLLNDNIYKVGARGQKYSKNRAKVSSECHALGRAIAGVSHSMHA